MLKLNITLLVLFSAVYAQTPRIVPTFHCLGIYWSPEGGEHIKCHVNYRVAGQDQWFAAQDLWYDDRQIEGRPKEYRGSIVNLQSGTTFQVQLWLQDDQRTEIRATATTWPEEFPVQETVYVTDSDQTMTITESGSFDGYVLHTSAPDQPATIDVRNEHDFCIYLPEGTHHVILRGLTIRGASRHAIRLSDNCHDIVIEECDISSWGNADSTGYGINLQAAISAPYRANNIERLIIQRNHIHHPRANANSWGEPRPNSGGDPYHPQGPYGIVLYDTRGNHVIRYNQFYTDEEHYFCDILGAGSNISHAGFPNRDSDIYGNVFEYCWDDAIEAEGANENVRIWGNEIQHTYHPIGAVVTSVGPMYIWRNVIGHSRKFGHIENSNDYGRGEFIKCGGTWEDGLWLGDGRMYVYHNTVQQPLAARPGLLPLGCEGALVAEGKHLYNVVTRNNIFTNYKMDSYTFRDNPENETHCGRNDFDFDLYTGRIKESCPNIVYQRNGISLESNDQIIYNPADPAGPYALAPGTPGFDAGTILPNFNDDYKGRAPDMGAFESKIDTHGDVCDGCTRPEQCKLYQNFPNPFNSQTRIPYFTPEIAHVKLSLFNMSGRLVRELANHEQQNGFKSVIWDGSNQSGHVLSSGIYLCLLQVGRFSAVKKIILLR